MSELLLGGPSNLPVSVQWKFDPKMMESMVVGDGIGMSH